MERHKERRRSKMVDRGINIPGDIYSTAKGCIRTGIRNSLNYLKRHVSLCSTIRIEETSF